jgi:hypothetical protein
MDDDNDYIDIQISDFGRIKFTSGRITYGYLSGGYYCVNINGKKKRVHRLAKQSFDPNENSDELQVDHIDRDRKNNKLDNLR